ncbi:MATE family efflux transporter [Acetatifactor aquisgranensis]|uniref:MATE family efflux transporter n=1 Tax=Acetatifactor aquisgranensis TaxID=2941233 RepID=UPI00203C3657|nr:MATE family efflux transporter [Acetatifactor aquisgranensis]
MNIRKKLFGDKAFYRMVLGVTVPIMIQNGITNFVGLLDNIMVGRIGTEQMSGIAIVNQLLMVFNLAIFGAISGVGIFSAQFFGCKNHQGVRHTLRFKIYVCMGILVLGIFALVAGGEQLIMLYLHGEGNDQALQATLAYGKEYLWVMLAGLFPFVIEEVYASTLREGGETKVPMIAGVVAVLVNLALNYLLIFGKFGFPELGVVGAAIATVISRYVQAAVVIVWTHRNPDKMPFIVGAYRELRVPAQLTWNITKKGTPLMFNEILWSAGVAIMTQCYSTRGLDAVAALNISTVISNLFNVVFVAMGSAVSIIVGQLLGAGKMEEAMDTDRKLIAFAVLSSVAIGAVVVLLAPLFPQLYNTSDEVKRLAALLLRVAAVCMPVFAFLHTTYFTLRSGGKTIITFLFDSVFLWCVSIPVAYVLSRHTGMAIAALYLSCQMLDLIKCVIGYILVKKGVWLNNIVAE